MRGYPGLAPLAAACAAAAAALGACDRPPSFQKGERVCFIGDSNTHGGRYPYYIHLFYLTRFPDSEMSLYNCGVSGDTAEGALRRLEWDILPRRPTVVTICFGMNDVNRDLYAADAGGGDVLERRREAIDGYVRNLTRLGERLRAAGVRTIFLTPPIYEENAMSSVPSLRGVNGALSRCSRHVRAIARRQGSPVVDMHAGMDAVNRREQGTDPAFTLVGEDRVHSGCVGQFVMAYLFLKAQRGLPRHVSRMAVRADTGEVLEARNAGIRDVRVLSGGVSFEALERALPYPELGCAAPAARLVPFEDEFNQEPLRVERLPPGAYELLIDGASVGDYSARQLAAGVNLAANEKTPQRLQARRVALLNDQRMALEYHDLRSWAEARHMNRPRYGGVWPEPVVAQALEDLDGSVRALYKASAPTPHRYEIRRRAAGR